MHRRRGWRDVADGKWVSRRSECVAEPLLHAILFGVADVYVLTNLFSSTNQCCLRQVLCCLLTGTWYWLIQWYSSLVVQGKGDEDAGARGESTEASMRLFYY
ncbi:hypothetical protein AAC387_Pa11g1531 [Persea americana]